MINSTIKSTRFQYAATLLGALAIAALAPTATAYATNDNEDTAGPGGCHYTDAEGHDVPIFDGSDVFVDSQIVSCRGGKITITTAPKTAPAAGQQQTQAGSVLAPVSETPKKAPVVRNVPVVSAKN